MAQNLKSTVKLSHMLNYDHRTDRKINSAKYNDFQQKDRKSADAIADSDVTTSLF